MSKRSASFHEYTRLTRELHRLKADNRGRSDEGDTLREQMDEPWWAMTEEERQIIRQYAADLYTLRGRPFPATPPSDDERIEFDGFVREGRLLDAMRLLHFKALCPPAASAWLRAAGWRQLGDEDMSVRFARLAQVLAPSTQDRPISRSCSRPLPKLSLPSPEARP